MDCEDEMCCAVGRCDECIDDTFCGLLHFRQKKRRRADIRGLKPATKQVSFEVTKCSDYGEQIGQR